MTGAAKDQMIIGPASAVLDEVVLDEAVVDEVVVDEVVLDEVAVDDEMFFELTLYVSGASDLAARAIANARRLCDLHCNGRYHLSVIDIHEDPSSLLTNNLLATPTLVKSRPTPVRRVVGDLSHAEKVVVTLDLPSVPDPQRLLG